MASELENLMATYEASPNPAQQQAEKTPPGTGPQPSQETHSQDQEHGPTDAAVDNQATSTQKEADQEVGEGKGKEQQEQQEHEGSGDEEPEVLITGVKQAEERVDKRFGKEGECDSQSQNFDGSRVVVDVAMRLNR